MDVYGDGTVLDSDPAPGKFDVKMPFESYWKLCVKTPRRAMSSR